MSDNGHSAENSHIRFADHRSGLPMGHYYGAHGGGGFIGFWRGFKNTFFEGGLRVPAIMCYRRKLPKHVVRNQPISVLDWYPTVLELCDIEPPDVKLDGHSLLPIIRNEKAKSQHEVMHWQWFDRWAVRKGPWKLIEDKTLPGHGEKRVFLGNLDDKMPERKNYADEQPKIVAHLRSLHQAWVRDVTAKRMQDTKK